jgi:hypothetical protein
VRSDRSDEAGSTFTIVAGSVPGILFHPNSCPPHRKKTEIRGMAFIGGGLGRKKPGERFLPSKGTISGAAAHETALKVSCF